MPYDGEYEAGPHDCYPPNCTQCIMERYEREGKRDANGVLHASNGGSREDAFCIGHLSRPDQPIDAANQRCTVLVRHCEVLTGKEQVAANRLEDAQKQLVGAQRVLANARQALEDANRVEARAAAEVRRLSIALRK